MNKFALTLTRYLNQSGRSAAELERTAGLGNGWCNKVRNGASPSPEKIAALLSAMPDDAARPLLRDYLLDTTPEEWRARVSVIIAESLRVADTPARPFDPNAPDAYDHALAILAKHATDSKIRRHIFSLIEVLRLE